MAADRNPKVRVKSHYQRSVRLDTDFDRSDALDGYVLQASPRNALEVVAQHVAFSNQRAFTWTGPYGGGKSSLALALAVLAGGVPAARRSARDLLQVEADEPIGKIFGSKKPWQVIPIVGRRASIEDCLADAIDKHAPLSGRRPMRDGKRDVIAELTRRSSSSDHGGVLLILDELGKFLEFAASNGDDIFFYQELAEAASRSDGRLVVVGVLHQAFEQYASRLGRDVREEWAKIQGRFVDVPIVAGNDEVLDLIGRAIETTHDHRETLRGAKQIAAAIKRRRPSTPPHLAEALDRCWPLHPITAALLGPSSRRKFGQNERSVFGFLASVEPLGFRDFLASRGNGGPEIYTPALYWNYLRANLENAILNSPDGHRWAIGAEAVERVEARFDEPHVSLVKTVSLIEMFRNGSGIAAETEVLAECVPGISKREIETALEELSRASVLIYRKHLNAWGVFAGSDFDIESSVATALASLGQSSLEQLKAVAELPAVSARRHYVETGTLRWFDRDVILSSEAKANRSGPTNGFAAGRFVLILPTQDLTEAQTLDLAADLAQQHKGEDLILYGVPRRRLAIAERAQELAALELVARTRPELEGDAVARREIDARLRQLRSDLSGDLADAFGDATWFSGAKRYVSTMENGLSAIASSVCKRAYPNVPVIHSEVINRDSLSSSAAKAQRLLLHRMLEFGSQKNLGYEGFPADAGLYYTVLAELGLHRRHGSHWAFAAPPIASLEASNSLVKLWEATTGLLEGASGAISLRELYALWRSPPFGLKQGLMPILALAYLLANRSRIAIYLEGTFTPELTDAGVDEWLQDPERVSWKWVRVDASAKRLLTSLAAQLQETLGRPVAADPLDSARALVSQALSLPEWTQRTSQLSEKAKAVRTLLVRASDPIKVIFSDLPEILGTHDATKLVREIGQVVSELEQAYPKALSVIERQLLRALDHEGPLEPLSARAIVVQGISGDFKLDAFASRLRTYTGRLEDIEGMMSLAVSKPPQSFTDHDFSAAAMQLAKWGFEFRQIEALATVQGRKANRQAVAVVFGGGDTVSAVFDVSVAEKDEVAALAKKLLQSSKLAGKPDIFLAALVEAGAEILRLRGSQNG